VDLRTLRLVDAVGAGMNLRSSFSKQGPAMVCIRTEVFTVASPVLVPLSYPAIGDFSHTKY